MPCWTVQSNTIEFLAKSTDVDLLKKTLEKMGFTVHKTATGLSFRRGYSEVGTYEKATGRLTLPQGVSLDAIKRGYSEEVVNEAADRQGWQVDWSVDRDGNREATVVKRTV